MPDENLVKYIKDGLAQGRSEDVIRSMLTSNGWAQKDVDDAFNFMKAGQASILVSSTPIQPSLAKTSVTTQAGSSSARQGFFSWKGRMGRLRYLIASIVLAIVFWIIYSVFIFASFLSVGAAVTTFGAMGLWIVPLLVLVFIAIEILPTSFIAVKRFHDIGKSGWYFWGLIVPFFNIYLYLSLFLECGTDGPNKYGADSLPPGKNHHGFVARLGGSVVFKLIITLLLSSLIIYGIVAAVLQRRQRDEQLLQQQQTYQSELNALIASSTGASSSTSSPATVPSSTSENSAGTTNTKETGTQVAPSGWASYNYPFTAYNSSSSYVSGCFAFNYPSILTQNAPNWFTDQNGDGLTLGVGSTESFQDLVSLPTEGTSQKNFETAGGLQGEEFIPANGQTTHFIIAAYSGNQQIILGLDFRKGNENVPSSALDLNTEEMIARSIVFPCPLQ